MKSVNGSLESLISELSEGSEGGPLRLVGVYQDHVVVEDAQGCPKKYGFFRTQNESVQSCAQMPLAELMDKKLEYIKVATDNILRKSSKALLRYEPEIYEQSPIDTSRFTIDDISEAISARLRYPTPFMPEYADLLAFVESVGNEKGGGLSEEIVETAKQAFRNLDVIERFLRGRNHGKTNKATSQSH